MGEGDFPGDAGVGGLPGFSPRASSTDDPQEGVEDIAGDKSISTSPTTP